MDTADLMRKDWDERARKDAFHYIASWRKDWTPESFFQSGEEDYKRLVAPVFDRLRWRAVCHCEVCHSRPATAIQAGAA